MKFKSVLCLVLAVLLLAGCAKGADGSEANSEQQTQAQEWRQAYYDVVMENLVLENRLYASELYFFEKGLDTPIMLVLYTELESGESAFDFAVDWYQMWRMEEEPVLILDVAATRENSYICVNVETQNPTVRTWDDGYSYTVFEVDGNNRIPLYDYMETGDIYMYQEDKHYTWEESMMETPVEKLPIQWYDNSIFLSWALVKDEQIQSEQLKDYLLDEYQPPVPKEAPFWVSQYVKLIHNKNASRYANEQLTGYLSQISLLEPPKEGAAPLIATSGGNWEENIFGGLYWATEDGMRFYSSNSEGGFSLLKDINGKVIARESIFSYHSWYVPTDDGLVWAFHEGDNVGPSEGFDEMFAFCDGEGDYFSDAWEMKEWRDEQRAQALARLGYSGELEQMEPITFDLFKEASWQRLEPLLIEILCHYAQELGQWG